MRYTTFKIHHTANFKPMMRIRIILNKKGKFREIWVKFDFGQFRNVEFREISANYAKYRTIFEKDSKNIYSKVL